MQVNDWLVIAFVVLMLWETMFYMSVAEVTELYKSERMTALRRTKMSPSEITAMVNRMGSGSIAFTSILFWLPMIVVVNINDHQSALYTPTAGLVLLYAVALGKCNKRPFSIATWHHRGLIWAVLAVYTLCSGVYMLIVN